MRKKKESEESKSTLNKNKLPLKPKYKEEGFQEIEEDQRDQVRSGSDMGNMFMFNQTQGGKKKKNSKINVAIGEG